LVRAGWAEHRAKVVETAGPLAGKIALCASFAFCAGAHPHRQAPIPSKFTHQPFANPRTGTTRFKFKLEKWKVKSMFKVCL
jgi:hypothetical protein